MTDAPFTETHRETLKNLRKNLDGVDVAPVDPEQYLHLTKAGAEACAAALAEIDRLTIQNGILTLELKLAALALDREIDRLTKERNAMNDAAEMLWITLANVSLGDWTKQSAEWQEDAARWRDTYLAAFRMQKRETNAYPARIMPALGTQEE